MFKGSLEDFPKTVGYGKKIDALRKHYVDYLWNAEYIDTQEARVLACDKPHFPYSVFKQAGTGKHAVVIANFDQSSEIQISVNIEGISEDMVAVSPENPEMQKCDGTFSIPPRSVVVVMEISAI